ncbi:hypothetical protein ACFWCB_19630 [Streptomyces sp. NPDC060048]
MTTAREIMTEGAECVGAEDGGPGRRGRALPEAKVGDLLETLSS